MSDEAFADLKRALESEPMSRPEFVYTSYIRTTPERLWQALTDPAFTGRYWGVTLESDWAKGSPLVWVEKGVRTEHPDQVVLESQPYQRLSYTWHTFTAEWAAAHPGAGDHFDALREEPRSKVTFDLEPVGELVRLTVVHDGFAPGSTLLGLISQGWPHVLSSLKTLLETGAALPA